MKVKIRQEFMITSGSYHFAPAYRFMILPAILLFSTCVPFDTSFAQPALKDVVKEEEAKEKPAEQTAPPAVKVVGPEDELERGVPRTTMEGFLDAALRGDYKTAAEYLDLRNLPPGLDESQGPWLAELLKVVLDRALWVDLGRLSENPKGHAEDGLPAYRDFMGEIETPEKTYHLFLQRVPRGDGVHIWKVSNATVAQIPELYGHVGYGAIGEFLSDLLPDVEFFGARLWQWAGVLVLMVLAYAVVLVPTYLAALLLRRKGTELSSQVARYVAGPLRFLLWVVVARASLDLISPTVTMQAIARGQTLLTIAVVWNIFRISDFIIEYETKRLRESGQAASTVLLGLVRNIARVLIIIVALVVWLDNIGFKVTTIIAGLGVGGIAVALAAKSTIEDFIGAIIILTSQPVKIGDFCRFGNTLGTVEDIGIRSTRVRTLENTLLVIPNASFSELHLENFTKREKIWYHPRVSLQYETTQDQVRTIISEAEGLLRSHPKVLADSARIRFTEIGSYALNLDVFAYVDMTNDAEYLKVAEELNFGIMGIVEKAGARLALPVQLKHP
jgi:MscS family membrane protein